MDRKLMHWAHIRMTSDKAVKMVASLLRLMPNINGPKSSKRKILLSVAHSILLYGAEIWAHVVNALKYYCRIASVQRRFALRVACPYCTVSEAVVLVVAEAIPIDLLSKERKAIYERKAKEPKQRWNSIKVDEMHSLSPVNKKKQLLQTDTFVETVCNDSGGLKTKRLDRNFESKFSYKTNIFSFMMRI